MLQFCPCCGHDFSVVSKFENTENEGYLYVSSNIYCEWQKFSLYKDNFSNFNFPNEALFELCDKLTFKIFISRCVKKITKGF